MHSLFSGKNKKDFIIFFSLLSAEFTQTVVKVNELSHEAVQLAFFFFFFFGGGAGGGGGHPYLQKLNVYVFLKCNTYVLDFHYSVSTKKFVLLQPFCAKPFAHILLISRVKGQDPHLIKRPNSMVSCGVQCLFNGHGKLR